jgi:ABC-type polysaccharide/polyol phosphate export permease
MMPGVWLLLGSLAAKELKVRYKRSLLGFAWFLLKPLFNMVVFSFVFTRIIPWGGSIEHYPLFLLSGLLVWNFFSSSLSASTTSLLDNQRLIRSIRFPRAALPASSVLANLVHLLLSLAVLEVVLAAFGRIPSASLLMMVPAAVLLTAMTVGIAMIVSVWNVYHRDVAQFVEVVLLAWFYGSPVIYPADSALIPEGITRIMRFNPVAGVLEVVHSVMYEGSVPEAWTWISMSCWAVVLLAAGWLVFRRAEAAVVKEL